MPQVNPYEMPAGLNLDRLIQQRVMRQPQDTQASYSTNETDAARVLARLKSISAKTIVVGRTALKKKRWFARYETDSSDGTEVLAETRALAICRLALLYSEKEGKARG